MSAPPLDLPALQRVVDGATPGRWFVNQPISEHDESITVYADGDDYSVPAEANSPENATFIATFNPETVGALLGEVGRLTAERDRAQAQIIAIGRAYGIDAGSDDAIILALDRRGERMETELARLRRVEAAAQADKAILRDLLDSLRLPLERAVGAANFLRDAGTLPSNVTVEWTTGADVALELLALTGEPPARSGEG